jgi:small subunit ribosomal protein S9
VTENPQDEPRNDEAQTAPPEPESAPETETEAAAEPETDAAAEPETEAAAEPQPEPAEPEAVEPEVAEPQAVAPEPEPAEPEAAPAPAAEAAEAAPAAQAPEAQVDGEDEEVEVAPRQKPEIPGADLIPDIIPEGDQFLDAEAQAAAEAEAEAAAALAQQESESEESKPIADAAIDLAAGARYTATGKRKTAVARVILKPGTGTYSINDKSLEAFFPRETLQRMIRQPLEAVGYDSRMDVIARMHGGGVSAQAGALRHGVSRALIEADPNLRGELKRRGFLTRDPRVKERKKAGLKKARKRPQFSKR